MRLKTWLKIKKWHWQHRFNLFGYEWKGKKHLAISRIGWRGAKWTRVFTVEQEDFHSDNLDDFLFKQITDPEKRT